MFKKIAIAAATAIGLTLPAQAELPKVLNFGIISTESAAALEKSFSPLLKEMSKTLGVEVKPFFAADYAGIIEGMRFKKVDIAWYGNKSAIEAVDRAGGEVFAQTIKHDGARGYHSLLLTHKDNNLSSLADVLKCDGSKIFGNGDPNSTSGFAIPGYYVWALNNQTPEDCFKRVTRANHEGNAIAVATKKVDVATNNTESVARLQAAKPELAANLNEIWRSPLIPSDPMVWRKDLSSEAKAKIHYFFMQFGRFGDAEKVKAERAVLAGVGDGWGPFLASSNAQLNDVRQIELFKKKIKAEKAGDKEAIAKIDADLAALGELSAVIGNAGF